MQCLFTERGVPGDSTQIGLSQPAELHEILAQYFSGPDGTQVETLCGKHSRFFMILHRFNDFYEPCQGCAAALDPSS